MIKSRVTWFVFFYLILSIFVSYCFIYLVIIWQNKGLVNLLYKNNFEITGDVASDFESSNFFCIFILPIIGFLLALFGFFSLYLHETTILRTKSPQVKLFFLVINFIIIQIGLYLTCISQLFYLEWDNDDVFINIKSENFPRSAAFFYQNWINLTKQWVLFGVFFGLKVITIIIIIRIYFLNVEYEHYHHSEKNDLLIYEWKNPLPANFEFNPNETQTITITLDDKSLKTKRKVKKNSD